jgi:hypothetical protein
MKNVLILLSIAATFSSCSALKSAFKPASASSSSAAGNSVLIDDIAIKPDADPASTKNTGRNVPGAIATPVSGYGAPLEMFSINQFKYAMQLNVPVETITNVALYDLIDEWWRTPYRLGGTTKKGVDCSAFVQTLMLGVFAVQLPRTARDQRTASQKIDTDEMREGDLVFFNTRGGVSHVGIYLHNNKFVHASTSGGVMISDLNEDYWRRKFIGAGRILQTISPRP